MKKARFITIEGFEGCGKSSVIKFLEKTLKKKGVLVKIFREPGSTKIGEKIREILLNPKNKELTKHTELLLYLAARTQLIEEKLKKALTEYDFVICDRFFDSTLVYQGYALGLSGITQKAVKLFSLGIKPNLTLILDLSVEVGLSRLKSRDRIESREISYHRKLREGFLSLSKKEPYRIKVINAGKTLPEIFNEVENLIVNRYFKER